MGKKRLQQPVIDPSQSLSRSVQNIILSNFDVSTVILPKDRLHKKGGFYEKKVKDGFEVLELEKGGWVEAIFAKQKSQVECRLVRFDKNDVYALAGSPCRYADIIIEGELTARMVGLSGKFVQMAARGIGTLMAPAFIFTKENKFPVSMMGGVPPPPPLPPFVLDSLRLSLRMSLNDLCILSANSRT